jgi:hypothetical protein
MITNTGAKTAIIALSAGPKPDGSWLKKLLGQLNEKYPDGLMRMKTTTL